MHERQHLPLRGVPGHRGRGSIRSKDRGQVDAMQPFAYVTADDERAAIESGAGAGARFLAGGTTLIDLMKLNVERPSRLVNINTLPLDRIDALPDGGVRVGALVRNSDMAHHELIRARYPFLA